jgi:RimJ/RimL family protein N-acetyltransferase
VNLIGKPAEAAPPQVVLDLDGIRARAAREADAETLLEAVRISRKSVGRWMSWCHPDYALEDTREWIARSSAAWADAQGDREFALFDPATGEALGCAGLNQINRVHNFANLGYWVRTDRESRGIASAAARAIAAYGFTELGLTRIEVVAQVENQASRRVAEKIGARFECVARNRIVYRNEPRDAAVYSLVPEDLSMEAKGQAWIAFCNTSTR